MLYIKLDILDQQERKQNLYLIYSINKPHKEVKRINFLYTYAEAKEQYKGVNDM